MGQNAETSPSISPYFPFPASVFDNLDARPDLLADFSKAYAQFLASGEYEHWHQDKGWRITAPMTIEVTGFDGDTPIMTVDYAGTHPVVRVFYSPGVFQWLLNDRRDAIPDGEIIIKQQAFVDPVAKAIIAQLRADGTFPDPGQKRVITRDSVIPEAYAKTISPGGFPSMIKIARGAFDGWYWGDWGADHNYPYFGRSAFFGTAKDPLTADPDANPIPEHPSSNWFNSKPGPPNYPTGSWNGQVVFPMDGFGGYCLNCHGSAEKESTFSDVANMRLSEKDLAALQKAGIHIEPTMPFELIVRYQPPETPRPSVAIVESDGGTHAELTALPSSGGKYSSLPPRDQPLDAFKAAYDHFFPKGVTWDDVWATRFPAQTYDHVVSSPGENDHNSTTFLTSDQCVGCHSAAGMGSPPVNMEIPHVTKPDVTVDVSPYGEWQTSLMGLAGRDPVFFAQVQSEAWYYRDNPEAYNLLLDTCLYCHGAMGRRQWANDGHISEDLEARKPQDFFPRAMMGAYPFDKEQRGLSNYGSLAREGISCMVCHTMDGDTMGIVKDGDDVFFKGTSTFSYSRDGSKVFGPYPNEDIKELPMEQALGISPIHGEHMSKSQLCGSCHVVRLPILNAGDGRPVKRNQAGQLEVLRDMKDVSNPGTDVDGKPVIHGIRSDGLGHGDRTYEQTTYFEWQNSVYNDETTDPLTGVAQTPGPEAQGCQDCHMPQSYHGKKLSSKIANIQDTDLADVHGRLPGEDVTLSTKQNFSRHSLNGINVFVLEMFNQFPLILGTQQVNYQNFGEVQGPFVTATERMLDFAENETAKVQVTDVQREGTRLIAQVQVTNLAGHFFPSGVSFRRAFLSVAVLDGKDRVLWASGLTNEVGELLDSKGQVLASEAPDQPHQPHYQRIDQPDQVQIYEEVVRDTRGHYTSSFTGMWDSVKDNRLRPKGFRNDWPNPVTSHLHAHGVDGDLDYENTEEPLWGGDRLIYDMDLGKSMRKAQTLVVNLSYQSIPPRYLKDKFQAAQGLEALGRDTQDIQRLYFLAGHLNVGSKSTPNSAIQDWKLPIASARIPLKNW